MEIESRSGFMWVRTSLLLCFLALEPLGLSSSPAVDQDAQLVVIVPFVLQGAVDEHFTAVFSEQLEEKVTTWRTLDRVQVEKLMKHPMDFRSDAPPGNLLDAARTAGADYVILGTATRYEVMRRGPNRLLKNSS